MTGSDIDNDARHILADVTPVTHSPADMLAAVNAAQREVVNLVPDSNTNKRDYTLTAEETAQPLPPEVISLADCVRNTGDGTGRGRAIRRTTEGEISAYDPRWTEQPVATEVIHYIYDETVPDEFLVWPRPATATHVELRTVDQPAELATLGQAMTLRDSFRNACVYYVVATRLAAIDDDALRPISQDWYAKFRESLGLKAQVTRSQPKESK